MKKMKKQIWKTCLDLLYPPRCPGCDRLVPPDCQGFCEDCEKELVRTRGPVCVTCGKLLDPAGRDGEQASRVRCRDCRTREHAFQEGRSLFSYQGVIRPSLYRFKYSNRRRYAEDYARELSRREDLCFWLSRVAPDLIVPVPMHRKKQRIRGYNQAAVFGRALSEVLSIPCAEDVLVRVKDTPALKTLTPGERGAALIDAFQCRESGVKLKKILLTDDIYTTGATADEAARVLLRNGAKEVFVFAVASSAGMGRESQLWM